MSRIPRPVVALVVAVLAILLLQEFWARSRAVVEIPFSQFQSLLHSGQVADVVVSEGEITGSLREPIDGRTHFSTIRVDPELAADLEARGVEYSGRPAAGIWPSVLALFVPLLLFGALWYLMLRRVASGIGRGGLLSVGQSKAKIYVETDTKVTYADVAGVDEAKAELQEIVSFLRDPAQHARLGARMPKGVLLVGPPGTGKTLLARAAAGEAGVPFFSISGSEFVELFVGVGAARVRDLFEQARTRAPCIIFIDELDALGRARGVTPSFGGQDEKEQTLQQLLVELDGFDPASGIVLLAATNRPEVLDPALLRAGRFDRQVLVDRPDRVGRVAILRVHLRGIRAGSDVDLDQVAALTPGFSGADLANLVNEAALAATRRGGAQVGMADFQTAIERIVAGLERKNRLLNPREREIVAVHEMGHAIATAALPGVGTVQKISIIPRGIKGLGFTLQRPTDDRFLMTRGELQDKLVVLLAGRAAEGLVFDQLSTGAADDLERATEIARSMVTRYGMVAELGHATYESESAPFLGTALGEVRRRYSEETAREIDCAVRTLIERALERAGALLRDERGVLDRGARALLERETLDETELEALFAHFGTARPSESIGHAARPQATPGDERAKPRFGRAGTEPAPPGVQGGAVTTSLRNRSILLAGPDRDIREVIADSLETEGARVYEATNRDEALLALRETSYDALILDLLLQGEAEVLRVAKEHQPGLGVLLLGESGSSAHTSGAHCLNRPFEREALLAAVAGLFSIASERSLGQATAAPPDRAG